MKFVSFAQLDQGSCWLTGVCIAAFSAVGHKLLYQRPVAGAAHQLSWTCPTAPANSVMPEGCAWRKVPLTRQEGHNGHRAAFSFQHLMPALQQQGLLPNELCTEAKTAGSVPQAAKQHGWKEAVLQSLRGTLLREGPTVVPPGVDCAGGSRWGQALGTPLHR